MQVIDYRARAVSILNGATGGRDSWSKWDREVFNVVDAAADEIDGLIRWQQAALESRDIQNAEIERLSAQVESLNKVANLLFQNAIGCATMHHGLDIASNGLPPWLRDLKAALDIATSSFPSTQRKESK